MRETSVSFLGFVKVSNFFVRTTQITVFIIKEGTYESKKGCLTLFN